MRNGSSGPSPSGRAPMAAAHIGVHPIDDDLARDVATRRARCCHRLLSRDRPAAARTRAVVRWRTCVDSTMWVEARWIVGPASTREMTSCRCWFDRAAMRQSTSPGPLIVWASSTSGIAARCLTRAGEVGLVGVERGEGDHRIADRRRVDLGPHADDDAGGLQAVEAGLGGAAGDAQAAGELDDADPRLAGELAEQRGVELVEGGHGATGCQVLCAPMLYRLSSHSQDVLHGSPGDGWMKERSARSTTLGRSLIAAGAGHRRPRGGLP